LIDQNHIIDVIDSGYVLMQAGSFLGISQSAFGRFVKNFFCQGGFARSGYARQTDKQSQGYANLDIF
jgi:hypothetical protein